MPDPESATRTGGGEVCSATRIGVLGAQFFRLTLQWGCHTASPDLNKSPSRNYGWAYFAPSRLSCPQSPCSESVDLGLSGSRCLSGSLPGSAAGLPLSCYVQGFLADQAVSFADVIGHVVCGIFFFFFFFWGGVLSFNSQGSVCSIDDMVLG